MHLSGQPLLAFCTLEKAIKTADLDRVTTCAASFMRPSELQSFGECAHLPARQHAVALATVKVGGKRGAQQPRGQRIRLHTARRQLMSAHRMSRTKQICSMMAGRVRQPG